MIRVTASGTSATRIELSAEAIRLARVVVGSLPEEAEALGLLSLMLLTDARRPARVDVRGDLVLVNEPLVKA